MTGLIVILWLSLCLSFTTIIDEPCPKDRPRVKALADVDTSQIQWKRVRITINGLLHSVAQRSIKRDVRQPEERQVFEVSGLIQSLKLERDGDVHLILIDSSGSRLTCEVPSDQCRWSVLSGRAEQYRSLRQWIRDNIGTYTKRKRTLQHPKIVTVTGVRFIDRQHQGSSGIEIHPVLSITFDQL